MKRSVYVLIAVLIAVTSCGKNGWYISVDNTAWEIKSGDQTGWVCYLDDTHVGLIQKNPANGAWQSMHGTFTVDGHRVDVSADGSAIRMVRTFSNLKNSSNKNYKRLSPEPPADLSGTFWANLKGGDLRFFFLDANGRYKEGLYKNVSKKEGFDYGWFWNSDSYTQNGGTFVAGDKKGQIYREGAFIALTDQVVPCVSKVTDTTGNSSLKGTLWIYDSGAYPGFIYFSSATEFTRVLVNSTTVFLTLTGTYTLKGNSLEFTTDSEELNRTCTLSDGSFTYLEKTYSLVSSF